jgi:hypothetical protein
VGLPELKELWSAGGPWHETLDDWTESREAALPRLHDIVARLLDGESSAGDFKSAMDSFSKQTKYGGFHGTSGQMFLNTLVNAGADDEVVIALRAALTAPKDEQDCRGKFTDFLAFVDEARERARDSGVAVPSPGYTPYFLSFFWEAENRDAWPIYYPNSRTTLAAHGLFAETGPLADRYLRFREQILRLRQELGTDTWGVESLLWHLKVSTGQQPPEPGGIEPVAPDDLYESYRGQGLIFPDEVVTSLVLSLVTKPFVLLSGISGTGKTQIAVGLAEYLDRRAGGGTVELVVPEGDDANIYIRLTDARLRLGRAGVTREHQAVFALHGLPERGTSRDYEVRLPDGTTAEMRLNNIGFSDPTRELYLLFFRNTIKQWLHEHAHPGDYLHIGFAEDGAIVGFDVVQPERRESETPARRHEVIAVRSDWTDPRGLIGYENPLTGRYTRTDLITLLLRAQADPERPYVVILDEMNLARVEYYFSDFLSAMELRGGTISLRESSAPDDVDEDEADADVPARLPFPPNVLVIGTVNIDETTHAFSPKVLDRANVIVFNDVDAQRFLEGGGEAAASTFRLANAELDPHAFADREARRAAALSRGKDAVAFAEPLVQVHEMLKSHNLHFGYRVLQEMTAFAGLALEQVEGDEDEVARSAFDLQLTQKVLPKFNGGRELEIPLSHLLAFCLDGTPRKNVDSADVLTEARKRLSSESAPAPAEAGAPETDAHTEPPVDAGDDESTESAALAPATYPRAARELARMLTRLRVSGFVAFLE